MNAQAHVRQGCGGVPTCWNLKAPFLSAYECEQCIRGWGPPRSDFYNQLTTKGGTAMWFFKHKTKRDERGFLFVDGEVIDLKEDQRALVRLDGRFESVLAPGVYALWKVLREIRVEIVAARELRFQHEDAGVILKHPSACMHMSLFSIDESQVGVVFQQGVFVSCWKRVTTPSGRTWASTRST